MTMPAMYHTPFAVLSNGLNIRMHFYFCLLVAVGLTRKQGRIRSNRQKNAFIMKWLNRALENVTFKSFASEEIKWLRREILRNHPDRDPEPMLHLIYRTAISVQP